MDARCDVLGGRYQDLHDKQGEDYATFGRSRAVGEYWLLATYTL